MSDPKEFPSDKADKFVVRLPDGMRERIAEAAKANSRSMNAEIIARLQDSFTQKHSSFVSATSAAYLDPIAELVRMQKKEMEEMRRQNKISAIESRLASLQSMRQNVITEHAIASMNNRAIHYPFPDAIISDIELRIKETEAELKSLHP